MSTFTSETVTKKATAKVLLSSKITIWSRENRGREGALTLDDRALGTNYTHKETKEADR